MSLSILLDHTSLTPPPPEGDADSIWQPVFSTNGVGVFSDSGSDYHVVSNTPEHLLLSVYPLLNDDRRVLKDILNTRPQTDFLFSYADSHLPYPYCLLVLDKLHLTLLLKNDDFGLARFYLYDGGSRVALSNRLAPIVRGSSNIMTVNYKALRMFGAIGWFPEYATPIEQINQLPPGTKVGISFENGFPMIISFQSNPYSFLFDLVKNHEMHEL